ncbi:uncharacterized protein ACWYII_024163 [Salvelinus alpinus]
MGKPLSRPDCLRQNPRCLGKGDEDEAYIEDCYVPQRSIYDTMRINEQIDQGSSKLSQPSRSTLGSGGGGEASTLSSNGTIGADLGSVFVSRAHADAGVKRLDERVIFDALKLTGDPQSMSPPGSCGGSGLPITPLSSASCGAAAVKRRHQGSDKKDNPNRRSWKAFMPPSYPEFAERLEFSPGESAEKRLSGPGIPLSLLPPPTPPTTSTPPLPPYSPSTLSSGGPHTPVSSSPSLTLSPIPPLQQHPVSRQKQLHPLLQKQHKQTHALPSPSKEQPSVQLPTQHHQGSGSTPQQSPNATAQLDKKKDKHHRRPAVSPKAGIKIITEESPEAAKASDSERETDSPLLEQDLDKAPLLPQLAPPKPVFCPPTKARTWPRSMRGGKRSHGGMRHLFPVLPPLPPLLGEDSDLDEESFYLLDPPSPFLQEEEGLAHGGLPLSPCLSQEGGEVGLLGWAPPNGELRQRTASELKFEEDERRILQELEEDEVDMEEEGKGEEEGTREGGEVADKKGEIEEEEERARREEREWEAMLKLENREIIDQCWEGDSGEGWEPQQSESSGHWPLLTPPTGFGGPRAPSASPCPSSGAGSDDLFLELERQCLEEEGGESSVDPESSEATDPYTLASVEEEDEEEEEQEEATAACIYFVETAPMDIDQRTETDCAEPRLENPFSVSPPPSPEHMDQVQLQSSEHTDLEEAQPCYELHQVLVEDEQYHIDEEEQCVIDYEGEEERRCPETTEMDSVCGLLPESDSSGVHMSQPDRTALSDTTQNDCEHEPPAESEWELDSGASSVQEVEETGLCLHTASPPPPSPSPQNPYAKGEEQEVEEAKERAPDSSACEQPEPSWDSEEASVDQSPGSTHSDGEMRVSTAEDVDELTSCQEELFSSEISEVAKETTSVTEGMTLASSDTWNCFVPADKVSSLNMSGQDMDQRSTSTPKALADSLPRSHSPAQQRDSAPPSPLPLSPVKHEPRGPGLDSKNSDAFVATDSFVYLAVSVPPPFPQDCPPSPLDSSTPPSPVPKPCPEPDEGAFLCSDSFVYLAAPERLPQGSDGGSACEDAQELDYGDSYSEGTQSGVDFVLGSMTGDSDWESDGSTLDPPCTNREWEELESGLLQGLFREGQLEDQRAPVATTETEGSDCETPSGPVTTGQGGAPSPCPDIETQVESDGTIPEIRK